MQRQIATPAELDFETPGRRDYYVALAHDSIWGDHLIPLTVMVGPHACAGEGLVAFGANHGNEYEGPVAIRHLLADINQADVVGRIILVPILNVAAFRAGTRDSSLDDGKNLNRAFVDGAGRVPALAGITHRIAAFVRAVIWPLVHVVIDLHAGGQVARFALGTSFHPIEDAAQGRLIEETARWFGTKLVIAYQNETPGLLPSEAERLGKITIGGEFGWAARSSRRVSAMPATACWRRRSITGSCGAASTRSRIMPTAPSAWWRWSIATASPRRRSPGISNHCSIAARRFAKAPSSACCMTLSGWTSIPGRFAPEWTAW